MGGLHRAKEIGLGQNLFGMVAKGRIKGGEAVQSPLQKLRINEGALFIFFRGKADMTYEIR